MFFFRISVLVTFTLFFQNGETSGSSSHTKDDDDATLAVEYNNLLNVDTGYSNDDLLKTKNELKVITESAVKAAKEKVYRNLLCSYVFTCQHYMNLIQILVYQASESLVETVFKTDVYQSSVFQKQIALMFFVLKHLGTVNSLEPLWMVYTYLECLNSITNDKRIRYEYRIDGRIVTDDNLIKQRHIRKCVLLSYDHNIINGMLTQFTNKICHPKNMYNHQYDKSVYFKQLEELDLTDENAETAVREMFSDIIQWAERRFLQTKYILNLDGGDDEMYFLINDLRLPRITLNDDITVTLAKKFAKILFGHRQVLQDLLNTYCSSNHRDFYDVKNLSADVRECIRMFDNLMKYIIARNVMKYVLDAHDSTLAEEPISLNIIKTTNETMLSYTEDIIFYLKMDDDKDLKFLTEMLNSEPRVTFGDPRKNADNQNRIKNIMVTCSKVLYNLPPTEISSTDLDPSYKSKRRAKMVKLAKLHGIEVTDSDGNDYEGMLDLFVLKNYIAKLFVGADFGIVHSFFRFADNIYE